MCECVCVCCASVHALLDDGACEESSHQHIVEQHKHMHTHARTHVHLHRTLLVPHMGVCACVAAQAYARTGRQQH